MKARSIITLALLAGCNYDYNLLAQDTGDTPPPQTESSDTYTIGDAIAGGWDLVDVQPSEPPVDEGTQEAPPSQDTGEYTDPVEETEPESPPAEEPPPEPPVDDTDTVIVEEEPPPSEEPPVEEPPAEEPPPPPPVEPPVEEPPPVEPDPLCDLDLDGWDGASCGGSDCNDGDASIHPLAGDVYGDTVDRDCDRLNCNAGWVDGVYFAACQSTAQTSHDEVETKCLDGGHTGLAAPDSPTTYAGVLALRPIKDGYKRGKYRIGLTSAGTGEPFYWDTGSSPAISEWAVSQPTYTHLGLEELCGVIYPNNVGPTIGPNKLNDAYCWAYGDENYGFVCETRGE